MSNITDALSDVASGISRYKLWSALAMEDIRHRYRRTFVGVLWVAITFGLFISVKVVVFGNIMSVPFDEYSLYVTFGFLAWQFISASVTEGCSVFVNSENWIKGVKVPLTLFVCQSICRNTITFLYSLLASVVIIGFIGHSVTFKALILIPVYLVYVLNAMWISLLLGTISARYRDFLHLVSTAMRIIFFLTPILWMPSQFGSNARKYADYNPFTHYLAIFRDPILYDKFSVNSWMIVMAITLVGWFVALMVFSSSRKRIVFWL